MRADGWRFVIQWEGVECSMWTVVRWGTGKWPRWEPCEGGRTMGYCIAMQFILYFIYLCTCTTEPQYGPQHFDPYNCGPRVDTKWLLCRSYVWFCLYCCIVGGVCTRKRCLVECAHCTQDWFYWVLSLHLSPNLSPSLLLPFSPLPLPPLLSINHPFQTPFLFSLSSFLTFVRWVAVVFIDSSHNQLDHIPAMFDDSDSIRVQHPLGRVTIDIQQLITNLSTQSDNEHCNPILYIYMYIALYN